MHFPVRIAAILLAVACTTIAASAQPRNWRNSEGTRTFTGEYVTHDARRVTIRTADGRMFTLDLTRLHADDRAWLATQNPVTVKLPLPTTDTAAVFDTLRLGDSINQVQAKLKASKEVELTIGETYLARVGLNGSYRTTRQIGGLHCLLSFDWTEDFHLRELILQTEPQPLAEYGTTIAATWRELIKLLSTLHGPPVSAAEYPTSEQLTQDGMILGSHIWRTESGASAVLGTGRDSDRYCVVVRFTTEPVMPAVR